MNRVKCTNCGHEEEVEEGPPPGKCPFCKMSEDEAADMWEGIE